MYPAHIRETGERQTVQEHCRNTAALAASAYFCGRSLGARKRFALLFAGLSISVCSVVYAQMITIGAYYVPHAVLTNLYVGLTARLMTERKHGRRRGILALLEQRGEKVALAAPTGRADRVVRVDGGFFHSIPVLRDDSRGCGGRMGVSFPCRGRERAGRRAGSNRFSADADRFCIQL